jgi:pyruvate formate lyase activating enzyme
MVRISRRRFLLGTGAASVCGVGVVAGLSGRSWWEAGPRPGSAPAAPRQAVGPYTVEAHYYTSFAGDGSLNCTACHNTPEETLPVSYCHTPHSGSYVQCSLCPHRCVIASGERGICRVRENRGGRLYSLVYGNACAAHVDPIEKKPFYHFLPSATAFSIATAGCNLRCLYCQNWNISQMTPEETENVDLPPESVVHYAQQAAAPVIAYTYSEPTAFFEYMMACARLGREAGLRSAVISAGFIEQEPLRELCQAVDAIKIDLKGYDAGFYRKVCSAELAPVLRAIETIFRAGVHLEIVNLVVPGLNDNPDQLRGLARWVAKELSPDVPLHFSRFMPQYKLANLPPTPVESLDQARQVAGDEGLRFVYVGNVPGHSGNNTYCPVCRRPIIVRSGFTVTEYHLTGGDCAYCGAPIPGVWWPEGPSAKPPVQVRPGPSDQ